MRDSDFYRAFEDKHRGSRALIKSRLMAYLSFLQPLLTLYPEPEALDLGCGRGEWLELLTEQGFAARGVDLDDGMLAACYELGLPATNQDAIAALNACADDSLAVVSAFHVVEHIPFETLRTLVHEAFRVLKPGGLLILETPNPENLTVGATNFYLDPTHQRPIPPLLLSYLPEYVGFYRTKIVRLQEPEELQTRRDIGLLDVLSGVSPDYSIVAQKPGRKSALGLFDSEFERNIGLDHYNLAIRFDSSIAQRFSALESLCHAALAKSVDAEAKAIDAGVKADQFHGQLMGVYASRSWRLTKPLRWFNLQLRRLPNEGFKARFKALIKKILRRMFSVINNRPRLKNWLKSIVYRLGLYPRLRNFYIKTNLSPKIDQSKQLSNLGQYAQQIHARLSNAMMQHNKEER